MVSITQETRNVWSGGTYFMRGQFCREKRLESGVAKKYSGYFLDELENLLKLTPEQKVCKRHLTDLLDGRMTSLLIAGSVGNGKTLLASSACNLYNVRIRRNASDEAYYTTLPDLSLELRSTFGSRKIDEDDILGKYSGCSFLVIDEIPAEISDYERRTLNQIFVNRYAEELPTVIIGNLTQTQCMSVFDAHVWSRLKDGEMLFFAEPDMRGRKRLPIIPETAERTEAEDLAINQDVIHPEAVKLAAKMNFSKK